MYTYLNDRLILSTRRNKTESQYLQRFLNWLESFDKKSDAPENLIQAILLLKKHEDIEKFDIKFRSTDKWISGSVASVLMEISNKAFKIPVVCFTQNYDPGELSITASKSYIEKLNKILKQ